MSFMHQEEYCTVCGKPLDSPYTYGDRSYCHEHLMLFSEDVPSLWRASTITLGLVTAGVLALIIANQVLPADLITKVPVRLAAGTAAAVGPAAAWLFFLYRISARQRLRLSALLPTVFVLAALLAAAAARPILLDLIGLDVWLWRTNAANRFLGNLLIAGFFHMFLIYVIVRYTVWQTADFSRRVHGVMYTLAAGLGYATMLNLLFVLDNNGLELLNGGLRLVTQLFAYIAPSMILGYFLGRSRFEDMPVYFLSGGQIIAAAASGLLIYITNELNTTGLAIDQDGFSPWPGLIVASIVMLASYGAIYGLLNRQNKLTRARLERAQ